MGIKHPLHRKKLVLAIKSINTKQDEKSAQLDHIWVTRKCFSCHGIVWKGISPSAIDRLLGYISQSSYQALVKDTKFQARRMRNFVAFLTPKSTAVIFHKELCHLDCGEVNAGEAQSSKSCYAAKGMCSVIHSR